MQQHTTVIDKAAMALSGGLMLLGVVVLGIVEILAGKPYSAAPLTNDAGEIIATPMVDPTLRTGLVLAGILVLALYGGYRLVAPVKNEAGAAQHEITAD
ncbi:hypothetical protein Har1130_07850 [Haloarcula sp. CBA1130]|uniref:hypothetical protein n=1 Tax=unclassified Haloarcula TaxID=2624677 RepID=UPI00124520CB|nr:MULTISPECIES: hypothetical protein [unclassified Haloarcula]KAA9397308.1 hypothetical protein Har1129_03225 [Haloarcula sp. CBA1129]KAA9402656.1 hypothetical protein Har1130_07850 [Haloarcula sp. CBA1130]